MKLKSTRNSEHKPIYTKPSSELCYGYKQVKFSNVTPLKCSLDVVVASSSSERSITSFSLGPSFASSLSDFGCFRGET